MQRLLEPFWALGKYHFSVYKSVLNNVSKSIVQIIKMSLLVIWAGSGALGSV